MGETYHHCTARFAGSGKASITTDTHLRFFWSKVTHVLEFKHSIPCSCGSHDTNVKPTRLCPPWYGLSCWHGVNHKALSQPIAGLHRDLQLVSVACLVGYTLIIHVCGYPLLNKSAEPLTHARVREIQELTRSDKNLEQGWGTFSPPRVILMSLTSFVGRTTLSTEILACFVKL